MFLKILGILKNSMKLWEIINSFSWFKRKERRLLKNHYIFKRIDEYVQYIIPSLRIPIKKMVFKDVLKIKFGVWKKTTQKMIDDFQRTKFANNEEFYGFILDYFNYSLTLNNISWTENGIPSNAIIKFNDWHHERVKIVGDLIKSISFSDIYSNYTERLSVILDCLSLGLSLTIVDADKTIKNVNGELNESLREYNRKRGYDWD